MSLLRCLPLLFVALAIGTAAGCATGSTSQDSDQTEVRSGDPLEGGTCGDAVCGVDETCASCSGDCGECEETCGDGNCGPVEDCGICPGDCGPCGATTVSASGSGGGSSTVGVGGNGGGFGVGGAGGGFSPMCGDGFCDPPETAQSCAQDCQQGGTCEHSACQQGPALTPSCDGCVDIVCAIDPFCCQDSWDATCVDEADFFCGCS